MHYQSSVILRCDKLLAEWQVAQLCSLLICKTSGAMVLARFYHMLTRRYVVNRDVRVFLLFAIFRPTRARKIFISMSCGRAAAEIDRRPAREHAAQSNANFDVPSHPSLLEVPRHWIFLTDLRDFEIHTADGALNMMKRELILLLCFSYSRKDTSVRYLCKQTPWHLKKALRVDGTILSTLQHFSTYCNFINDGALKLEISRRP
jgi:hypothetical protein